MLRMRFVLWPLVPRVANPILLDELDNATASHEPANAAKDAVHLPRAVPRRVQELLVDETHQPQRRFGFR